jgi:fructokinase
MHGGLHVRERVVELLNNYVRAPQILNGTDEYIVPPRLAENAGVLGALALAQDQLEKVEGRR